VAGVDPSSDRLRLGPLAGGLFRNAMIVGIVALLVSVGIVFIDSGADWSRFLRSWLTAFVFVLSLGLGGLFLVIIHHGMRAGWSVSIRRIAEGIMGNLVWLWVLMLPILLLMAFGGGDLLYHWADPHVIDPDSEHYDAVLAGKSAYLNPAFWLIRAVIFFGIWVVLARFFSRNSVAQDLSGDVSFTHAMQKWAPLAGILYALSQSYAIIDWGMSLEPHWFSTMYPVYFFAASACGFFAALIIAVYWVQRRGRVEHEITLEHYQDMGKLLFAFGVVFWAYIAFSQYMLIWYANLPEETGWFLARILGPWKPVSYFLLFGHFFIPFLLLVTKHTKRIKPVLALIALWMLFMHYVDMYWLIMPHVPAEIADASSIAQLQEMVDAGELDLGFHPHLLDVTCLVALVSFFVAGTARRLRDCALIPVQDPRLGESLAFENM